MAKLVAIGDSMTMGFKSGAIFDTSQSYPSMLAHALGCADSFPMPDFSSSPNGGLPINLEALVRDLEQKFPPKIKWWNLPRAFVAVQRFIDTVEKYWECGPGMKAVPDAQMPANLSVFTYTVSDSYQLSEGLCTGAIVNPRNNHFLFTQIPELPMYRAARRVLNPGLEGRFRDYTQIDCAVALGADEKIENLIVFLGANNCLGALIDLELRFSDDADLHRLAHKRRCNVWLPHHFKKVYETFAAKVAEIRAENVYVGTIPHVTIPPLTRGEGECTDGYFDYYTRPWIWDRMFDSEKHACISRYEAKLLDSFVDEYNQTIRSVANHYGWRVVDTGGAFDSMAYRRRDGQPPYSWPQAALNALAKNPSTAYLVQNNPTSPLDTRYLELHKESGRIIKGGLFSLDATHPTGILYGFVADMFLQEMIHAGVKDRDGNEPALHWDSIVASESLICSPPSMLGDLRSLLSFLVSRWSGRVLLQLLERFKGNV